MATWWETAEWVAKLSPSKKTKVYFLQHYEAFDCVPKGRVETTWRLMHKIAVPLWPADIARNQYANLSVSLLPPTVDTKQFYDPPVARSAAARQAISSHSRDVLYYNCLERLRYCPESFLYSC
jgi:hypothetical protein